MYVCVWVYVLCECMGAWVYVGEWVYVFRWCMGMGMDMDSVGVGDVGVWVIFLY